jgi:hypothetical protein
MGSKNTSKKNTKKNILALALFAQALYNNASMSLKNYAFLKIRALGFSPRASLRIINVAIAASVASLESGKEASFEECINLCLECAGKSPIF